MDRLKNIFFLSVLIFLTGCAPISFDTNPPTGNVLGPIIGGAAGAGAASILGAPKPVIGVAGVAGASLGYYFTTLRFASAGIIAIGGQVFTMGDLVIIDIPTDRLFDPNTAEFLERTEPVLDSIASVLARYPDHNIFIAGNTSGFWTRRFEHNMSECRAAQVASAAWARGITDTESKFKESETDLNKDPRRLIYVGYGNDFPIANNIRITGIRANSHIQIVAIPSYEKLHWDKCKTHFRRFENIGDVRATTVATSKDYSSIAYAFSDDHMPSGTTLSPVNMSTQVSGIIPPTQSWHPTTDVKDTLKENYSNVVIASQTNEGCNVVKQAGYKSGDPKAENSLG